MRIVYLITVFACTWSLSAEGQEDQSVSLEQLRGWADEWSNRGRWGADDELGTLNLISPDKRQSASRLVQDGLVVSLAHDLVPGENGNAIQPMTHEYMIAPDGPVVWTLDGVDIFPHGWAYTHLDALSHAAFDSVFYNDYGLETLTASGATRLGIDAMRDGIVSRGVLIDVPRLRGVAYLDPGTVITVGDLQAWEQTSGERVTEGDVLLIRTGRWAREQELGPWPFRESAAGLHPSIAGWLRERGVAAVGSDGSSERYPSLVPGIAGPFHILAIVAMGMPLFDNLDLEAVSHEAAARSRPTFFFVAAPLRVPGGSGSPVNPVAIF